MGASGPTRTAPRLQDNVHDELVGASHGLTPSPTDDGKLIKYSFEECVGSVEIATQPEAECSLGSSNLQPANVSIHTNEEPVASPSKAHPPMDNAILNPQETVQLSSPPDLEQSPHTAQHMSLSLSVAKDDLPPAVPAELQLSSRFVRPTHSVLADNRVESDLEQDLEYPSLSDGAGVETAEPPEPQSSISFVQDSRRRSRPETSRSVLGPRGSGGIRKSRKQKAKGLSEQLEWEVVRGSLCTLGCPAPLITAVSYIFMAGKWINRELDRAADRQLQEEKQIQEDEDKENKRISDESLVIRGMPGRW